MKYTEPPPKEPDLDDPANDSQEDSAAESTPKTSTASTPASSPSTPAPVVADSEEAILGGLTQAADLLVTAETTQVFLAAEWGKTHLSEPIPEFLQSGGRHGRNDEDDAWYQLSLVGLPYVDDFSIPSFAQAAKMSEYQARKLIRTSLVLTHLLPRVWGKAMTGEIKVFQAKLLAEACYDLNHACLEYIDYEMAHPGARHTETGRNNMITAAKQRYMKDVADQEAQAALESRDVIIDTRDDGTGLATMHATLDLPAAIALDIALNHGAAFLKANGCTEPIGVRRGYALVDLANLLTTQLAPTSTAGEEGERPTWDGSGQTAAQVQLFIHMTATDTTGHTNADGTPAPGTREGDLGVMARITGTGLPAEGIIINEVIVKDWITRHRIGTEPKIRITGVIDLNQELSTKSYAPTTTMKTYLYLRDMLCVAPFCSQTGLHADCDHIQPFATDAFGNPTGGATCTCNLAKLCRRHHLLKTHGGAAKNGNHTEWSYVALGDGNFLWTGPGGKQLLRTRTETLVVRSTCNHAIDAGIYTETGTDFGTETGNGEQKVWTMLDITETAAKAHRELWIEKTQRFDKAINLAAANNAHYKKYHRGISHPSHTAPTTENAGNAGNARTELFDTSGPVPF